MQCSVKQDRFSENPIVNFRIRPLAEAFLFISKRYANALVV